MQFVMIETMKSTWIIYILTLFHRLVKKGIYCSDWASYEQKDFEMGEA